MQVSQPTKGPRMQKSRPGNFGGTDISVGVAATIEVQRQILIEPITDAADNKERDPIFGAGMGYGRRFHVNPGDFLVT